VLLQSFMKFVSLGRERTHRQGKLNKPSDAPLEPFTKPIAVPHQIHTYTELQQQIHDDLRIQHPEWIQANGESPTCDSYESRLMHLLDAGVRGSNARIVSPHRVPGKGRNLSTLWRCNTSGAPCSQSLFIIAVRDVAGHCASARWRFGSSRRTANPGPELERLRPRPKTPPA
jgi:hypothetical protein